MKLLAYVTSHMRNSASNWVGYPSPTSTASTNNTACISSSVSCLALKILHRKLLKCI